MPFARGTLASMMVSNTGGMIAKAHQSLELLVARPFVRLVDVNDCDGILKDLGNPYYNIEGLGLKFVASPRVIPVDYVVSGFPPAPLEILRGILSAVRRGASR